jgi:hypothetical protein
MDSQGGVRTGVGTMGSSGSFAHPFVRFSASAASSSGGGGDGRTKLAPNAMRPADPCHYSPPVTLALLPEPHH